jgi:hypothetical protein
MIEIKLITPYKFYQIMNSKGDKIMGKDAVYKIIRRKDFPALKIGKRFYIIESKVDEWFSKQAEKFWCNK